MSKLVVSIGHVEFTGGSQVLYVVKVQQDGDEWEVRRTFSDFRKLRDDVARVMRDARAHVVDDECSREFARGVQALAFPAKRLFGSKKDHVVKERAVELHRFLIRLLVLTHTYRKAQKALYEHLNGSSSQQHQAAFAALQDRTQASVSAFYLLRDFLKPVTLRTNVDGELVNAGGGAWVGEGEEQEDEDAEASRRIIRESKMLAMSIGPRGSNPNHLKTSSSAPARTKSHHNEPAPARTKSHHNEPAPSRAKSHHADSARGPPPPAPIPVTVAAPAESPSKANSGANRTVRSNSKLVSIAGAGRSRSASRLETHKAGANLPTESLSDGRPRHDGAAGVTKAASTSALAAQVDRARTESYMLRDQLLQQRQEKQRQERQRQDHALHHHASADTHPPNEERKETSDHKQKQSVQVRGGEVPQHHEQFMQLMEQHQQQRHHSSASTQSRPKTVSHPLDDSESSQTSESELDVHYKLSRALSSASTGSAREAKHVLLTPEMTEKILSGGSSKSPSGKSPSERRRARAKKPSRSKHKSASARDIQQRESERLSRLSIQLTAQAISVSAQKELEKFVSEYTAIMVLRYVDRFISKAVSKAPGCYRVDAATHRLVIDSERFVEELDETFTDLPYTFPELFRDEEGDWVFPPALDAYAQLKWNSFHGGSAPASGTKSAATGSRGGSDNDSDSDSEYEYEQIGGGGGYMKTKKDFTRDEESMLQEMIANGTAGKDQVLRLRRQINESGWNRRENPGSRSQRVLEDGEAEDRDEDASSDTEDDDAIASARARKRGVSKSKSSASVGQYQRRQNALRKDRLSRVQSVGGLV